MKRRNKSYKKRSLMARMRRAVFNIIIPPHIRRSIALRWEDLDKFNPFIILFFAALISSGVWVSSSISNDHARLRDIRCLAMNIYHEARGEPLEGKYAVAAVTMNRANARRFPNDVCQVVYQRNWSSRHKRYISQFSWTNDKVTDIPENSKSWIEAVDIAKMIYDNKKITGAKGALFYHAHYVKPRWAKQKQRVARIGRHIFYN